MLNGRLLHIRPSVFRLFSILADQKFVSLPSLEILEKPQ